MPLTPSEVDEKIASIAKNESEELIKKIDDVLKLGFTQSKVKTIIHLRTTDTVLGTVNKAYVEAGWKVTKLDYISNIGKKGGPYVAFKFKKP